MLLHRFIPLALCVALLGCKTEGPGTPAEDQNAPLLLVQEDLVTLTTAEISDGPLISGSIQAKKQADLRAELSAVVLQVLKDNGDNVRQGDLLARLDDTIYREALRSSQEAVRAAQVSAEQTQRQLTRLTALYGSGAISTQAKEDALTKRDAAQAELAAAKARLAQDSQQLARTQITAPFDGIVAARQVSNGDRVQVGKALLQVIDPASVQFEGMVSAAQIQAVAPNQTVTFAINGNKDPVFSGQVAHINPLADTNSRQIMVTVSFAPDQGLSAGLFAEGRIHTQQHSGLMLPRNSLIQEGEHNFVWQVSDSQLKKVAVTSAARDPFTGNYRIETGLTAGAQVLRNPRGPLKDGASIRLEKTPTTTREAP